MSKAKQATQVLYKPKKEKLPVLTKQEPQVKLTWQDIGLFLADKAWDQRVYLLITFIILENVFLLVRLG